MYPAPDYPTETMSTSHTTDIESVGQSINNFVDSVTSALQATEAPTEVIETVEKEGQQLAETVDDEIEQIQQDLEDTQEHSAKERAELSGRISTVEDAFEGTTPTVEGSETTIQQDELTPIEQLSQSKDVSEVTDSPTVERAVSLFKNLPQWGSKTPKGIVLKPTDNPLSLLEADRDESLAWKQYYRACEALERLSRGSVTFFHSDRHGKMLCLHEQSEAFERLTSGSLSPSSVGAEV